MKAVLVLLIGLNISSIVWAETQNTLGPSQKDPSGSQPPSFVEQKWKIEKDGIIIEVIEFTPDSLATEKSDSLETRLAKKLSIDAPYMNVIDLLRFYAKKASIKLLYQPNISLEIGAIERDVSIKELVDKSCKLARLSCTYQGNSLIALKINP